MFSKGWKLSLLLVAAVTILPACQKSRSKKKNSMPYAGVWVNQKTTQLMAEDYLLEYDGLCEKVRRSHAWGDYGIMQNQADGRYRLDAWSITDRGEVYRHANDLLPSSANYRQMAFVGHVSVAGYFTPAQINSYYLPELRVTPFGSGQHASLLLEKDVLHVIGGRNAISYVRADLDRVRRLELKLSMCEHRWGGRRHKLEPDPTVTAPVPGAPVPGAPTPGIAPVIPPDGIPVDENYQRFPNP